MVKEFSKKSWAPRLTVAPIGFELAIDMRRAHQVLIYSRAQCHLCHDAIALVEEAGLLPTVVDIDQDEELRCRYGEWIPVVVIDGVERFRGRVDRRLLRRILI